LKEFSHIFYTVFTECTESLVRCLFVSEAIRIRWGTVGYWRSNIRNGFERYSRRLRNGNTSKNHHLSTFGTFHQQQQRAKHLLLIPREVNPFQLASCCRSRKYHVSISCASRVFSVYRGRDAHGTDTKNTRDGWLL
jgi:hypothetical protein